MNLKPLNDVIIITRDASESTTKSGLIIPHIAQQKALRSKVVNAGPGHYTNNNVFVPTCVKDGDYIIVGREANEKLVIKEDNQDYVFIREKDILCIVQQINDSVRLNPVSNLVMLRRLNPDAISKGGIIIPENARPKSIEAEVVAVGPGRVYDNGVLIEPTVKVGDIAILSKWAAGDLVIDNVEYTFIRETEIMAVYENRIQ